MATLHNEAREIYRRHAKLYKQTQDPLSFMTMKLLARCMKQIPERKEGGLHPIHRELILCFQDSIRSERRDPCENNAFAKIQDIVTMEDAKRMQCFYRLPKSKEHDETWHRKGDVKTLMNNWTQQTELEEAYASRNSSHQEPINPERGPNGWRSARDEIVSDENENIKLREDLEGREWNELDYELRGIILKQMKEAP